MNQQAPYYSNNYASRHKPSLECYGNSPSYINVRGKSSGKGLSNTPNLQYNSYSYSQHDPNRQSSSSASARLKYLGNEEEDMYVNYPPTFSTPMNASYQYPAPKLNPLTPIFSEHSAFGTPSSSDEMAPLRMKQPTPTDRSYRNHSDVLVRGEEEYYTYSNHHFDAEMEMSQRYSRQGYFTPNHSVPHPSIFHNHHSVTPHPYSGTQPLPSPSHQHGYYNALYSSQEEPRRLSSQYIDYVPIDYSEPVMEYSKPPMINTGFVYPYETVEEEVSPSAFHRPQMTINTSFDNDGFSYDRGSRTSRYGDYVNMSYSHTHLVSPSPNHARSAVSTPRAHMASFVQDTSPVDPLQPAFNNHVNHYANESTRSVGDCEAFIASCSLWEYAPYQEIWKSLRYSRKPCPAQLITSEMEEYIHSQIEEGINNKKKCHFKKARTIFIDLIISFPSYLQIWLEFTRLEMECGEYINASHVLEAALSYHQHNELLLQKKLRVEERLNRIEPIRSIIQELRILNTQKSLKIIMEAVAIVARMGYENDAAEYYREIIHKSRYYTGNFYMEEMLFEEHYGNYSKLKEMVDEALTQYPKYGPLWFYCFELLEHDHSEQWDKKSLETRMSCNVLNQYMKEAIESLTPDLLWKVYFIRIQFWCRTVLYMRRAVMQNNQLYDELIDREIELWEIIYLDTEKCLAKCPDNLIWKLYMIFGRFSAISGYQNMATKLFSKAYACVPEKFRPQVLLDYSKAVFFINRIGLSSALLKKAQDSFPNEWKLVLESIQQLVQQGYIKEALLLNHSALNNHIGAGRLWSSCIQLTHQLFGPVAALKVFKRALRHVAKSGEVWCEGCRIYLNPCSTLFSTENAIKCLNYAVFFTPQYGDSFIEIIRLMMICSDTFLHFHALPNPSALAALLCTHTPILHFIKRYSFYDPNYGPLWFRCKEFLLAPAKEVLYRSMSIVALEIALNAQLYYDALVYRASVVSGKVMKEKRPIALRSRFSTAIRPDYMYDQQVDSHSYKRKVQILYGASQLEF